MFNLMKKFFSEKEEERKPVEEITPTEEAERSQEQKIDTLADFLEAAKFNYDETEDQEFKKKLAYQIVKIEIALGSAGLAAGQVYVRSTPEGVLGYYDSASKQIALAEDVLADYSADQQLYKTILRHEKIHKEGIVDEGLAQIKVRKLISATPGIYTGEQAKARRTFYRAGTDKALELYDIDKPEELMDYFLEVELEKDWPGKIEREFSQLSGEEKIKEALEKFSRRKAEEMVKKLDKGAPRLQEKLKERGYNFKRETKEILKDLYNKNRVVA